MGDNTKVVNYTKVVIWHLVVNIQFLEQVWDFVAYFLAIMSPELVFGDGAFGICG